MFSRISAFYRKFVHTIYFLWSLVKRLLFDPGARFSRRRLKASAFAKGYGVTRWRAKGRKAQEKGIGLNLHLT